ncbi:MAG: efflux RND transporter periplasmic adaptor subunit [Cyanobacteria bacterium]|nr:efflux RND transporter periplasmic adaptor subunit [Cyanobacteriota bacterium]
MIVVVGRIRSSSPAAAPDGAKAEAMQNKTSADVVTISGEAQETIGLTVVSAEERPFIAMIQTTGVVMPNETRVARIRPLAPGRVEEVHIRVGDRVNAGQPLVTYDNIEMGQLAGEYRAAAAGVERAQAEADVARRALERGDRLVESGGISRAEYERRDAEQKRALAAISTERAAMAIVEQKLRRFGVASADLSRLSSAEVGGSSRGVLRAAFAGVVTATNVAPGDSVDTQRELVTVADLSTVWVLGDIYQKDLGAVTRGQEALITVESYPGQTFNGRITYISDVLDPASRTAKVRAEVPNRDGRLRLQMFVSMQVPTGDTRSTIVIPSTAIQEIDEQTVVFVQTGVDTFEKRAVALGPAQRDTVPVLEGVKAGDRVVTTGAFMLKSKLKASSIEAEGEEPEKQ